MNCPLCNSESKPFKNIKDREYFKCSHCWGIFLHPKNFLSISKEKERYLQHENNVLDEGYQHFVQPLVQAIIENHKSTDNGLDFGSGTGPVITKLLWDQKYDIVTYDPYFDYRPNRLKTTYDYIVSCEVIEHFKQPHKEFTLLKSLLREGGNLFLKTHLWDDSIYFESWYYKDDPTHVFIYHKKTMNWIQNEFDFKELQIENRMIHLKN